MTKACFGLFLFGMGKQQRGKMETSKIMHGVEKEKEVLLVLEQVHN